ncbi:hypothetical protein SAMN04488128_1011838 [Chitinophaga eiseniae]|uniref:Uncharacterized protein n=1 Tax=Chitinophaga eiseniae TaxID=634771 RepID=A0A1T4P036_9BACT|nr:DNRLRE domain-containing protein [Chitinophaga eiseniae]SJZ84791.1 hypothetical protein SAMN04488128_1011838 [Chitinophaga eiseniae]
MKFPFLLRLPAFALLAVAAITSCKKDNSSPVANKNQLIEATGKRKPDTLQMISPRGFFEENTGLLFGNANTDGSAYLYRQFIAGNWTVSAVWYTYRSYFVTSVPLPSGDPSLIKSATLMLYSDRNPVGNGNQHDANYGSNNAFFVRRITTPLSMTTMGQFNWFNQPAVTTANQVLVPHTNQTFRDEAVDVTAIVRQLVSDANQMGPLGLMIQLQSEGDHYNIRIFCGSTNVDVARRPTLIIQYN